MILACPAVAALAGPPGQVIIVDNPPSPITVIALQSDRVAVSYSPPPDFAGYHFRYATSPGQAWGSAAEVDSPVPLRASPFVLLTGLPASAVEVLCKPQDLAGQEGDPEARQLLGAAPPAPLSLAPDYAVAWALQHSDAGAGVNQHTGDSELYGGTAGDNITDRAAALWTLRQFTPPFAFEVTYNPGTDPSPTPMGGIFFQIALALALGADPNVAHLAAGTTPRDVTYGALLNGVRLSIDTNGYTGAATDQVRIRAYNGTGVTGDLATVGGQKTVAFPRGQDSVIEVTAPGDDTLSCKVTFPDGSSVTQDFQDTAIRTWLGGRTVNVGLLAWAGRSAKLSAASERAVIVKPPPGGNEGLAPPFSAPAASTNIIQATAADLTAKYATANGGDIVLVAPGFSYTGNLTLGRSGSKGGGTDHRPDNPIVVRVGTLAADGKTIIDPASFPAATIVGDIISTGKYNWVRGFTANGLQIKNTSVGFRLNRGHTKAQSQNSGTYTSLDWVDLGPMQGEYLFNDPVGGCRYPFLYRCDFHDDTGTPDPHRVFTNIGASPASDPISVYAYVRDCLFRQPADDATNRIEQAVEMKSCDNIVERCAALSRLTPTVRPLRFNIRHGQRNRLIALWADKGQIEGRGPGHLYADCVITGSDHCGPAAGNVSYTAWQALANKSGKYPSADDNRLVRCDNSTVGDSASGTGVNPVGTQVWDIVGSLTLLNGATVAASDIHPGDPADVPPRTDSGAKQWASTDVGPNATWDPADTDTYWYQVWRALADA